MLDLVKIHYGAVTSRIFSPTANEQLNKCYKINLARPRDLVHKFWGAKMRGKPPKGELRFLF